MYSIKIGRQKMTQPIDSGGGGFLGLKRLQQCFPAAKAMHPKLQQRVSSPVFGLVFIPYRSVITSCAKTTDAPGKHYAETESSPRIQVLISS